MEFIIRPIGIGDGKGINELRRMPGVFENILGIPSERIKRNEDIILNMDSNSHQFVATTLDETGTEKIIGKQDSMYMPTIVCDILEALVLWYMRSISQGVWGKNLWKPYWILRTNG